MATNGSFDWAMPVMRAGYGGRALVYLAVAGVSLRSLLSGGEAKDTSTVFQTLESSAWGMAVLALIFVGMICYAIWRLVDAAWDLECYGSDGEGIVARIGMCITGLIHAGIGIGAGLLIFTGNSGGGESTFSQAAGRVLGWEGGRWILGAIGLVTIGAGLYYAKKAYDRAYRKHLQGNEVTRNWDVLLRIGVAAQGFVVGAVGAFILYAAWAYAPEQAGGLGELFSWLSDQAYGRVLVVALCLGLLCFALFCAVNAIYRIVPRASDPDIPTLAARFT